MKCAEIISKFLSEYISQNESYEHALKQVISNDIKDSSDIDYEEGKNNIIKILTDVYCLNSKTVKTIANTISKNYAPIGRNEKDLIKHYLDYGDIETYNTLLDSVAKIGVTDEQLSLLFKLYSDDLSNIVIINFTTSWFEAEMNHDEAKKIDYLQGIYTRLVPLVNDDKLTLKEIFLYNRHFLDKELSSASVEHLKQFCDDIELSSKIVRRKFCVEYEKMLNEDMQKLSSENELYEVMNISSAINSPFEKFEAEKFGLVVLNINQELYDALANENAFWNNVLSMVYYSYRVLDNHRTLAINIDNIITTDGRNLKWLVYSYIGIYAEHFIPSKNNPKYYRPEELCYEKCLYLGIQLDENSKSVIKKYYLGKSSISDVANIIGADKEKVKSLLLDFENIWYGYTFSDCLAIQSGDYRQNEEIKFIKNCNQLVLIFNKYRPDDRKIPCPECAGLDISGNSFPEVGLKSWECKNSICPSRSKSNRGKRYSKKSNFMQSGYDYGTENDIISKELIKKWRRDISTIESQDEIYLMLVKYFSFDGESVLFVNNSKCVGEFCANISRISEVILPCEIIEMPGIEDIYNSYFNGGNYVKRYINQIEHPINEIDYELTDNIKASKSAVLINGDSRKVLSRINNNIFSAAVTSPPYYNARLYSQWPNLYLYLSDMYEIIKQVYRTLKPGGIYLYNIGDICGNENTVVRSNMGNKRIILGAYTIHLFMLAGFELLDNLLWDKGEPQSNRQKNDGKFTPYYQKPMNVYEHMFIFKKPGAPAIINPDVTNIIQSEWCRNIVPFTPVIKINSKGENTLGHTAPFPIDIPDFVAKAFTQKKDDIILEPFAGSGTSLLAASRFGVKSVGIELCEEYVELIKFICRYNDIPLVQI